MTKILKDTVIAAADTGPNSSPLEFMLRIMSALNLSADLRIGDGPIAGCCVVEIKK